MVEPRTSYQQSIFENGIAHFKDILTETQLSMDHLFNTHHHHGCIAPFCQPNFPQSTHYVDKTTESSRRFQPFKILGGDDFETAICHQFISTAKPIVLNATDINGSNPITIALDFSHCDTLQFGKTSLGSGHENVLTRGYEGYPRFDFIQGPLFIQASIGDFGRHNTGSAKLSKAFNVRDTDGTNQIERYLNDLYGPDHSAKIHVPVPGFRVVYIRGSPGKPSHRDLVKRFPDVRHASFEEVKENLFKIIVT
ncbi:hypothetical protein BGW38_001546 [Lunasporangiospora selenospora]|uniref:Uncharacterized protein n=1 Tax=Lunasporangiospora selenospora TaxID=979761 RepID=A0A9P6FU65_9FUNG|nr:hypothetical protein BGW38_001546 [Lunasporangiospora selenospora]